MFLWCLSFFPILAYAQKMQDIPKICLENNACYKGSWLETNAGSQYASFQGDLNFDYYYHIKVKEHFYSTTPLENEQAGIKKSTF